MQILSRIRPKPAEIFFYKKKPFFWGYLNIKLPPGYAPIFIFALRCDLDSSTLDMTSLIKKMLKIQEKNVFFCKNLRRFGLDPAKNFHGVILWYSPQLSF